MNASKPIPFALLAAILTAGCASAQREVAAPDPGWRRAQVLELLDGSSDTEPVAQDCRREAKDASGSERYALTTDELTGAMKTRNKRIVPVPEGVDVRVGHLVYLNPIDCRAPLRRIGAG